MAVRMLIGPARGVGNAQADDAAHAVWAQQRGVPGDGCAPVVADHHRLLLAQRLHQADDVADQV